MHPLASSPSHQLYQPTQFDDWRSITVAIYMALVGYGVMVGIPVISTAWVSLLGFSEVQIGRVAGADLGGFSAGAVLVSRYVARVNRRYLVLAAAAVAVTANGLCMVFQTYEQTLVLRIIAGIGSGAYTAVAVATLAGTAKPARAFNILLFSFAFSQGGALYLLPKLSMNEIYLLFIVTYILGLLAIRWLPAHPIEKRLAATDDNIEVQHEIDSGHGHIPVPKAVPWLVLAAVLFTYLNIGAYWTYIELASAASDADPEWVGKLLVYTSVFSVVGCACATLISNRFGLARPLMVTLLAQAIIVGMLAGGINNINVMISMFAFNFCWIFVDVYQSATIANLDSTGRFAALMPGAQGLGQILGPNLAATILAMGMGYSYLFILCAISSLIALAIWLFMYLRLRKQFPALADAS
ncbi:MAG: putative MFS family arabinose efflux permease [Halioglobus sp.]|jgi:predicted MFS family arabinose efflux permease